MIAAFDGSNSFHGKCRKEQLRQAGIASEPFRFVDRRSQQKFLIACMPIDPGNQRPLETTNAAFDCSF